MPGLPFGILKQLEAAGFDPSSRLPPVNLQAQLVYILNDLSKRSLPLPIVQRMTRHDVAAAIGEHTSWFLSAGRRCVHLLDYSFFASATDHAVRIMPSADRTALDVTDKTNASPRVVAPVDGDGTALDITSVYGDGRILTANRNTSDTLDFVVGGTEVQDRKVWPIGAVIPPGFTMVVEQIAANQLAAIALVWEELGP